LSEIFDQNIGNAAGVEGKSLRSSRNEGVYEPNDQVRFSGTDLPYNDPVERHASQLAIEGAKGKQLSMGGNGQRITSEQTRLPKVGGHKYHYQKFASQSVKNFGTLPSGMRPG